jgi:TolA-binding protein
MEEQQPMSDTSTSTDAPKADKPVDQQPKQGDPADKPLGENGEKALRAERDRAKDLERQLNAAQSRLTEIERANESALEKAQREAQEAKNQAQQAAVEALRFRIAAETGITENVDLILTAADEETMRRQAQLWGTRAPSSDTTAGPRPDLTQGGSGQPPALNSDGLEEALRSKLGI